MASFGFKQEYPTHNCEQCQRNATHYPSQPATCPHHSHNRPPTGYPSYPAPPPYNPYYNGNSAPMYPQPPTYPQPPAYPQPPTNSNWPPTHHHGPSHSSYAVWVDCYLHSPMPNAAVRGGTDIDGQPIYVGRAFHEGDWLPAKVIPGRRCCYVSYDGKEYAKTSFQVLSHTSAHWVPGFGGQVPHNAIEGGRTVNGEKLYIGRVMHQHSQTVGKIHPSHRNCYIPFDGREIAYAAYDVLVSRN